MLLNLFLTYGILSLGFFLAGVIIPERLLKNNQEGYKVIFLILLMLVTYLFGIFKYGEEFNHRIRLYCKFKPFDTIYVLIMNSILFSYVFLYKAYTNQMQELTDNMRLTFTNYYLFKAYILAPLIEELYFRLGFYLFLDKTNAQSKTAYVILSSIFFGLCHVKFDNLRMNLSAFVMTFVFGLYAAVVMCKTESVWCCFILHSYCNMLGPPLPLPNTKNQSHITTLKFSLYFGIPVFFVFLIML